MDFLHIQIAIHKCLEDPSTEIHSVRVIAEIGCNEGIPTKSCWAGNVSVSPFVADKS